MLVQFLMTFSELMCWFFLIFPGKCASSVQQFLFLVFTYWCLVSWHLEAIVEASVSFFYFNCAVLTPSETPTGSSASRNLPISSWTRPLYKHSTPDTTTTLSSPGYNCAKNGPSVGARSSSPASKSSLEQIKKVSRWSVIHHSSWLIFCIISSQSPRLISFRKRTPRDHHPHAVAPTIYFSPILHVPSSKRSEWLE